jgi:DNA-binding transcriptional ArsR family regulator
MHNESSAYGLWGLVLIESAFFIVFAFSFTRCEPATLEASESTWNSSPGWPSRSRAQQSESSSGRRARAPEFPTELTNTQAVAYLTIGLDNQMVLNEGSNLDRTFAALADPTRRAILARLASGRATVSELGEPFEMSGPAISKHLRVLERAGLVRRGREAQTRPCQLVAAPLKGATEWLEEYRHFWEQSLGRLEEYLHGLKMTEELAPRTKGEKHGRRK